MSLKSTLSTALAVFSIIAAYSAPEVRADTVLDQEYTTTNVVNNFSCLGGCGLLGRIAETFTVGVAGTLSEIDVFFTGNPSFFEMLILSTVNGVPTTGTVAGTGLFQSTTGNVAVFTTSLPVTIGEVLAIEPVINRPQPGDGSSQDWLANRPGTYSGGQDYETLFMGPPGFVPIGLADDFRTFVTVSGPIAGAGIPGLILACGILLILARRRQQIAKHGAV